MRKIQLKNAHGQIFDLLRRDAIFKNMDGIGFRKETDFPALEMILSKWKACCRKK